MMMNSRARPQSRFSSFQNASLMMMMMMMLALLVVMITQRTFAFGAANAFMQKEEERDDAIHNNRGNPNGNAFSSSSPPPPSSPSPPPSSLYFAYPELVDRFPILLDDFSFSLSSMDSSADSHIGDAKTKAVVKGAAAATNADDSSPAARREDSDDAIDDDQSFHHHPLHSLPSHLHAAYPSAHRLSSIYGQRPPLDPHTAETARGVWGKLGEEGGGGDTDFDDSSFIVAVDPPPRTSQSTLVRKAEDEKEAEKEEEKHRKSPSSKKVRILRDGAGSLPLTTRWAAGGKLQWRTSPLFSSPSSSKTPSSSSSSIGRQNNTANTTVHPSSSSSSSATVTLLRLSEIIVNGSSTTRTSSSSSSSSSSNNNAASGTDGGGGESTFSQSLFDAFPSVIEVSGRAELMQLIRKGGPPDDDEDTPAASPCLWVLLYYDSRCGHCLRFAPTYGAFASDFYDDAAYLRELAEAAVAIRKLNRQKKMKELKKKDHAIAAGEEKEERKDVDSASTDKARKQNEVEKEGEGEGLSLGPNQVITPKTRHVRRLGGTIDDGSREEEREDGGNPAKRGGEDGIDQAGAVGRKKDADADEDTSLFHHVLPKHFYSHLSRNVIFAAVNCALHFIACEDEGVMDVPTLEALGFSRDLIGVDDDDDAEEQSDGVDASEEEEDEASMLPLSLPRHGSRRVRKVTVRYQIRGSKINTKTKTNTTNTTFKTTSNDNQWRGRSSNSPTTTSMSDGSNVATATEKRSTEKKEKDKRKANNDEDEEKEKEDDELENKPVQQPAATSDNQHIPSLLKSNNDTALSLLLPPSPPPPKSLLRSPSSSSMKNPPPPSPYSQKRTLLQSSPPSPPSRVDRVLKMAAAEARGSGETLAAATAEYSEGEGGGEEDVIVEATFLIRPSINSNFVSYSISILPTMAEEAKGAADTISGGDNVGVGGKGAIDEKKHIVASVSTFSAPSAPLPGTVGGGPFLDNAKKDNGGATTILPPPPPTPSSTTTTSLNDGNAANTNTKKRNGAGPRALPKNAMQLLQFKDGDADNDAADKHDDGAAKDKEGHVIAVQKATKSNKGGGDDNAPLLDEQKEKEAAVEKAIAAAAAEGAAAGGVEKGADVAIVVVAAVEGRADDDDKKNNNDDADGGDDKKKGVVADDAPPNAKKGGDDANRGGGDGNNKENNDNINNQDAGALLEDPAAVLVVDPKIAVPKLTSFEMNAVIALQTLMLRVKPLYMPTRKDVAKEKAKQQQKIMRMPTHKRGRGRREENEEEAGDENEKDSFAKDKNPRAAAFSFLREYGPFTIHVNHSSLLKHDGSGDVADIGGQKEGDFSSSSWPSSLSYAGEAFFPHFNNHDEDGVGINNVKRGGAVRDSQLLRRLLFPSPHLLNNAEMRVDLLSTTVIPQRRSISTTTIGIDDHHHHRNGTKALMTKTQQHSAIPLPLQRLLTYASSLASPPTRQSSSPSHPSPLSPSPLSSFSFYENTYHHVWSRGSCEARLASVVKEGEKKRVDEENGHHNNGKEEVNHGEQNREQHHDHHNHHQYSSLAKLLARYPPPPSSSVHSSGSGGVGYCLVCKAYRHMLMAEKRTRRLALKEGLRVTNNGLLRAAALLQVGFGVGEEKAGTTTSSSSMEEKLPETSTDAVLAPPSLSSSTTTTTAAMRRVTTIQLNPIVFVGLPFLAPQRMSIADEEEEEEEEEYFSSSLLSSFATTINASSVSSNSKKNEGQPFKNNFEQQQQSREGDDHQPLQHDPIPLPLTPPRLPRRWSLHRQDMAGALFFTLWHDVPLLPKTAQSMAVLHAFLSVVAEEMPWLRTDALLSFIIDDPQPQQQQGDGEKNVGEKDAHHQHQRQHLQQHRFATSSLAAWHAQLIGSGIPVVLDGRVLQNLTSSSTEGSSGGREIGGEQQQKGGGGGVGAVAAEEEGGGMINTNILPRDGIKWATCKEDSYVRLYEESGGYSHHHHHHAAMQSSLLVNLSSSPSSLHASSSSSSSSYSSFPYRYKDLAAKGTAHKGPMCGLWLLFHSLVNSAAIQEGGGVGVGIGAGAGESAFFKDNAKVVGNDDSNDGNTAHQHNPRAERAYAAVSDYARLFASQGTCGPLCGRYFAPTPSPSLSTTVTKRSNANDEKVVDDLLVEDVLSSSLFSDSLSLSFPPLPLSRLHPSLRLWHVHNNIKRRTQADAAAVIVMDQLAKWTAVYWEGAVRGWGGESGGGEGEGGTDGGINNNGDNAASILVAPIAFPISPSSLKRFLLPLLDESRRAMASSSSLSSSLSLRSLLPFDGFHHHDRDHHSNSLLPSLPLSMGEMAFPPRGLCVGCRTVIPSDPLTHVRRQRREEGGVNNSFKSVMNKTRVPPLPPKPPKTVTRRRQQSFAHVLRDAFLHHVYRHWVHLQRGRIAFLKKAQRERDARMQKENAMTYSSGGGGGGSSSSSSSHKAVVARRIRAKNKKAIAVIAAQIREVLKKKMTLNDRNRNITVDSKMNGSSSLSAAEAAAVITADRLTIAATTILNQFLMNAIDPKGSLFVEEVVVATKKGRGRRGSSVWLIPPPSSSLLLSAAPSPSSHLSSLSHSLSSPSSSMDVEQLVRVMTSFSLDEHGHLYDHRDTTATDSRADDGFEAPPAARPFPPSFSSSSLLTLHWNPHLLKQFLLRRYGTQKEWTDLKSARVGITTIAPPPPLRVEEQDGRGMPPIVIAAAGGGEGVGEAFLSSSSVLFSLKAEQPHCRALSSSIFGERGGGDDSAGARINDGVGVAAVNRDEKKKAEAADGDAAGAQGKVGGLAAAAEEQNHLVIDPRFVDPRPKLNPNQLSSSPPPSVSIFSVGDSDGDGSGRHNHSGANGAGKKKKKRKKGGKNLGDFEDEDEDDDRDGGEKEVVVVVLFHGGLTYSNMLLSFVTCAIMIAMGYTYGRQLVTSGGTTDSGGGGGGRGPSLLLPFSVNSSNAPPATTGVGGGGGGVATGSGPKRRLATHFGGGGGGGVVGAGGASVGAAFSSLFSSIVKGFAVGLPSSLTGTSAKGKGSKVGGGVTNATTAANGMSSTVSNNNANTNTTPAKRNVSRWWGSSGSSSSAVDLLSTAENGTATAGRGAGGGGEEDGVGVGVGGSIVGGNSAAAAHHQNPAAAASLLNVASPHPQPYTTVAVAAAAAANTLVVHRSNSNETSFNKMSGSTNNIRPRAGSGGGGGNAIDYLLESKKK